MSRRRLRMWVRIECPLQGRLVVVGEGQVDVRDLEQPPDAVDMAVLRRLNEGRAAVARGGGVRVEAGVEEQGERGEVPGACRDVPQRLLLLGEVDVGTLGDQRLDRVHFVLTRGIVELRGLRSAQVLLHVADVEALPITGDASSHDERPLEGQQRGMCGGAEAQNFDVGGASHAASRVRPRAEADDGVVRQHEPALCPLGALFRSTSPGERKEAAALLQEEDQGAWVATLHELDRAVACETEHQSQPARLG
mmetsp:Transcript_47744/g.121046  ORF Transcript_47744/g.121046 Transcript_47744/m.121046 type:complete len:251 (+) Transcript_47744:135-887(+)